MTAITTAEREEAPAGARQWFLRLLLGILFLILGFVVLGYDDRSLTVVSIIFGVSFVMTGLSWLLIAGRVDELRGFWIVAGLLALGAGVAAFVYPDETLKTLSLFLGWFLLLGGIVQFLTAVTDRDREGWWLGVAFGVVQLGLGAWAVGETDRSLVLLTTLVGVYCVLKGIYELVLALRLRRRTHALQITAGP